MNPPFTPALPLDGLLVLLLRADGQQHSLAEALGSLGAKVLHLPVIEIRPPVDSGPLDAALASLGTYQWLVFTSANAVEQFVKRARQLAVDCQSTAFTHMRVCAIGPATRDAALAAGLSVHLVPENSVAEGLVLAFTSESISGMRVLLPRAATGRDIAPDSLRAMGATVDVVETYRTCLPANAEAQLQDLLRDGTSVDWVIFSSGSTVKNFLAIGGAALLPRVRTLSIGPATSEVMRKHGIPPSLEALNHCADGLVDALLSATAQYRPHASMKSSKAELGSA